MSEAALVQPGLKQLLPLGGAAIVSFWNILTWLALLAEGTGVLTLSRAEFRQLHYLYVASDHSGTCLDFLLGQKNKNRFSISLSGSAQIV